MKKFSLSIAVLGVAALLISSGCNKKIVYSKDRDMDPLAKSFSVGVEDAYKAAKESMVRLGYKVDREDTSKATLRTTWLPTKADSHYVDLFDRRDYGTVGAYYRLTLSIREESGKAVVEIAAPVRSIVGRLKSSHFEENRIFNKMKDLLRKDDFEMSNIGVEE